MSVPTGALTAIARYEMSRRWYSLLVIGVIAGLVGGAVTGALALARRTGTAHSRLEAAVHLEDARVTIFGDGLVDEVVALPGVRETWNASLMVAKIRVPGVIYIGLTTGPERPADLFSPIVVEGRAADPSSVEEAVVLEAATGETELGVGDELPLKMLLPEEVRSFDTGFGEPDGPEFTLRIVGVVRVAGDLGGAPLLTTPAFAERYAEFAAGTTVMVRLEDRPGARADFLAAAAELNDSAVAPEGAEEFDPIEVTDSFRNEGQVIATSRVLVGGLAVFAAVIAIVGLIALAQVVGRHQSASVAQQRVEAALGLTAGERALARAVPGLFAGVVAALITFTGTLAAGSLEPSGVMRRIEPHPGWAPNYAIAALGAIAVATITVAICALSARRAIGANEQSVDAPSRVVRVARAGSSRPTVVAGLGFAFARDRAGRGSTARYSLLGVIVGIAGLVGSLTFASSLDRLAATPSRYGWNADFSIIDVTDTILEELAADPRLAAVTHVESKGFLADGVSFQAYSHSDRVDTTGWTIIEGHAPAQRGEIVLTAQAARRLDRHVGDEVVSNDAEGNPVALVVVGLGIGPNSSSEKLDELALVHPDDIRTLGQSQAFTEALVRVGNDEDVDEVFASYAEKYEVSEPTMPADVANIIELGQLPEALGVFLAAIAVVALVHLLAVTSSRRSRDLAVLRALGLTRGEVRRVIAIAAVSVTTVGLLIGVPLGFALGRLVWWSVAHSIGVAPDASYVIAPTLALVPAVLLASVVVAIVPAFRATRPAVVAALRAE